MTSVTARPATSKAGTTWSVEKKIQSSVTGQVLQAVRASSKLVQPVADAPLKRRRFEG